MSPENAALSLSSTANTLVPVLRALFVRLRNLSAVHSFFERALALSPCLQTPPWIEWKTNERKRRRRKEGERGDDKPHCGFLMFFDSLNGRRFTSVTEGVLASGGARFFPARSCMTSPQHTPTHTQIQSRRRPVGWCYQTSLRLSSFSAG